jgi:predicted PurR-regulated permease PerM
MTVDVPHPGRAPSLTRLLTGLASVVVVLAGVKAAADILTPVLLAMFLVLVIAPVSRWLRHRGLPAGVTLALVIGGVLAGALALLAFLGVSLAQLAIALPTYQTRLTELVDAVRASGVLGDAGVAVGTVVAENLGRALRLGFAVLTGIAGALVGVGWMLYLFVFMMLEGASFPAQLRRALGPESPALARTVRFSRSLSDFMGIKAGLGLLAAVGDVALLLVLGVDFAVLWGVLSFFLSFIPSVGFLLALIPPVLLALLEHGPGTALVVLLGYWLINGLVDSVLGPRVLSRSLDVSTIVTIVSMTLWGFLLGGVGALLSLPITVLIKLVLLEHYPESRWLATAIGSGQPPPPPAAPAPETGRGEVPPALPGRPPGDDAVPGGGERRRRGGAAVASEPPRGL